METQVIPELVDRKDTQECQETPACQEKMERLVYLGSQVKKETKEFLGNLVTWDHLDKKDRLEKWVYQVLLARRARRVTQVLQVIQVSEAQRAQKVNKVSLVNLVLGSLGIQEKRGHQANQDSLEPVERRVRRG